MHMYNFAWKGHPRNDLFCVGWDVKPYSLTLRLWRAQWVEKFEWGTWTYKFSRNSCKFLMEETRVIKKLILFLHSAKVGIFSPSFSKKNSRWRKFSTTLKFLPWCHWICNRCQPVAPDLALARLCQDSAQLHSTTAFSQYSLVLS